MTMNCGLKIRVAISLIVTVVFATTTRAITLENQDNNFDRWMYPFNSTPGNRASASMFAAFDAPDFDERDGQIILGWNTASLGFPTQLGPSDYSIISAQVVATVDRHLVFAYDPTYDVYASYVDGDIDADPGRPLELHGVATRNGYTLGFSDPTDFAEGGPFQDVRSGNYFEMRNLFASDFDGGLPRDISNNVDLGNDGASGFDPNPWSIGQALGVMPGDDVPINTDYVFELDLSNEDVVSYMQEQLNEGHLFFAASSLQDGGSQGNPAIPAFFSNTSFGSLGPIARLSLDVRIFRNWQNTQESGSWSDTTRWNAPDGSPQPYWDARLSNVAPLSDQTALITSNTMVNSVEVSAAGEFSLQIAAGANLAVTDQFTAFAGGIVSGSGTITGDLFIEGGLVSPGDEASSVVVSSLTAGSAIPEPQSAAILLMGFLLCISLPRAIRQGE